MRNYRIWKTGEIETLKCGLIPVGRSFLACRKMAVRLGIRFRKKEVEANYELLRRIDEQQERANARAKAEAAAQ